MGTLARPRLAAFAALVGIAFGAAGLTPATAAPDRSVVVFAAASLKNALDEINGQYQRDKGAKVTTSYAASSALARQVEAGAPADIFISADLDWMDYLAQRKLIKHDTRSDLLGNKLVLIAPADSTVRMTIGPNFPLAQALGDGRLSMAEPSSVPAGKYGKAALEALGVWPTVASKLALAENVRAALLLVARKEAPLGIVYLTDAAADTSVKVVAMFPDDSHPPIAYPVALTAISVNPDAAAYLAYLKSPAARAAFEKQGFTVLP